MQSPNQIVNHLSVRSPGQFDCSHNIAGIATHEHDSSRLYRHIRARANRYSDIGSRFSLVPCAAAPRLNKTA